MHLEYPHASTSSSLSRSIAALVAAASAVGVVMVFSAGATLDPKGIPAHWWSGSAARQGVLSIAAFCLFLLVSRIDYHRWIGREGRLGLSPWMLAGAIALCFCVFAPVIGIERNGARRWVGFGGENSPYSFQPSELCKPAMVLFLAAFLTARRTSLARFGGLLPALIGLGAAVAIVGVEDFGTAALIGLVGAVMIWLGGARKLHLAICAAPALSAAGALVWFWPYRMARITGFLHIWDDPQGKGYHPIQSLVAIATGGWTGLGLGAGVQKYGYLPEARSDFIYAVICEELGIIGGACVMALFGALLIQGYRAMRRAPDDAGRLIAMGGTLMIVLQALINVAVVTVSMPTKGIALPFISAGGSSAMFLAITAGLVANVARQRSAAWYVEQARSRDDAAARTPHANATGQVEPA